MCVPEVRSHEIVCVKGSVAPVAAGEEGAHDNSDEQNKFKSRLTHSLRRLSSTTIEDSIRNLSRDSNSDCDESQKRNAGQISVRKIAEVLLILIEHNVE